MKFPGRIYQGEKDIFLAIYSNHPDVCIEVPPSIETIAERKAHVQYSEGGKRRGIDVFQLREAREEIRELELAKPIKKVDARAEVDKEQDIQFDFVNPTLELTWLIRTDVQQYCKRPAKKRTVAEGDRMKYHQRITPVTSLRVVEPERLLTPGKQEFVSSCILEANIDFSQGCVSGWVPREGAKFDGKTFVDYFLDPWAECRYCYAMPKHKSFPKHVYHIEKQRLLEELRGNCRLNVGSDRTLGQPVRILRFGKRTETGSKLTLDSFILTLEACTETGTRGVVPTKFLEFNEQIAKLLKRTNSSLLYSIGWDEFEKGARSYGCTNKWRVEQAEKYNEAGVNTRIYLLILAHAPPTEREKGYLERAKKHNMKVQLLPVRFTGKELTLKMTDIDWDLLKGNSMGSLFRQEGGSWEYLDTYDGQAGVIIPKVHPSWREIVGDNHGGTRMCHHNLERTWCGGCGVCENGFVMPTPPRQLPYVKKQSRSRAKERGYQGQLELF